VSSNERMIIGDPQGEERREPSPIIPAPRGETRA